MFPPDTIILVVDDVASMRFSIKAELRGLGFKNTIHEAACVEDALQILRDQHETLPIQLIISDWNMPGKSGLGFLKKVRAMEKFKDVPFLMVTSETETDQIVRAARAGVSCYIIKPINRKTLLEKLKLVWKKHFPGEVKK